jgi:hypothetical protein
MSTVKDIVDNTRSADRDMAVKYFSDLHIRVQKYQKYPLQRGGINTIL